MRGFFECQRCTACCRWPGEVRLGEDEVAVIAGHLGMDVYDFVQNHTKVTANRQGLTLLEHADGACVWLDGIDCRLQEVKPAQCRGFPNEWNFPGWRDVCRAIETPSGRGEEAHFADGGRVEVEAGKGGDVSRCDRLEISG